MQVHPITLAIVDDHQIVIDGISSLLHEHPQLSIVHTSNAAAEMLELLAKKQVDILITDVMMPEITGAELAKKVRALYPHIKIIALSMSGQGKLVDQMINESDIVGYLLKNVNKHTLVEAIIKVAGGGQFFCSEVLDELEVQSHIKKETESIHLTSRELEIIRHMEQDKTNRQMADELFISERTVETHRKNIFRKTGTNNALSLVKWAYEHQLINSSQA